jgi:hypothetical protein
VFSFSSTNFVIYLKTFGKILEFFSFSRVNSTNFAKFSEKIRQIFDVTKLEKENPGPNALNTLGTNYKVKNLYNQLNGYMFQVFFNNHKLASHKITETFM